MADLLTLKEPAGFSAEKRPIWLHFLAISALHSTEDTAAVAHAHAIDLLREDVEAAIESAREILESAETDPLLAWAVINNVAALQHEECVELLHERATADFGERNPKACEEQRDSEVLVGIMAAEGLGSLANTDDAKAVEALMDVVMTQREQSIREAAGRPLLNLRPQRQKSLPDEISEELDRIGDLRTLELDDAIVETADMKERPSSQHLTKPKTHGGSTPPAVSPTFKGPHHG